MFWKSHFSKSSKDLMKLSEKEIWTGDQKLSRSKPWQFSVIHLLIHNYNNSLLIKYHRINLLFITTIIIINSNRLTIIKYNPNTKLLSIITYKDPKLRILGSDLELIQRKRENLSFPIIILKIWKNCSKNKETNY